MRKSEREKERVRKRERERERKQRESAQASQLHFTPPTPCALMPLRPTTPVELQRESGWDGCEVPLVDSISALLLLRWFQVNAPLTVICVVLGMGRTGMW